MPRRKVVLSGLLAFGAGVAVGANWPRAGNIVGYLLQRLGFELTDLALWAWDPEKSMVRASGTAAAKRAKSKNGTENSPIADGQRIKNKTRPKKKKRTGSSRKQSGEGAIRANSKKTLNGAEPWILDSRVIESDKGENWLVGRKPTAARSAITELDKTAMRDGRKKSKRAVVTDPKRKHSAARGAGKIKAFRPGVLPAEAALN